MIGKINIFGHIGDSTVDENGVLHKGTNLLNVIEQVESFPQATQLEISINSPGGYVDVGDGIYDYLLSLKKQGKELITIQTGLIGSIATKIFLAGDRRIVDDRYKFWIHNPFQENVSGDADALQAAANATAETEKALRKFYSEFTSISDEGLDGLMKIETGLNADQCIKFKFATEKKLIPAFNTIKPTMSKKKEETTLKKQLLELLGLDGKKGVQPKGEIPGAPADPKNIVVNLADGAGSFFVQGEALAEGSPAFLLDADGQPTEEPLADGDYILEDKTKVTISDGLVSAVLPAEEEEEEEESLTAEKVAEMINEALSGANKNASAEIAKIKKEAEDKIQNLKKTLKLGVQPTQAVITAKGKPEVWGETAAQTMARLSKEREEELKNK